MYLKGLELQRRGHFVCIGQMGVSVQQEFTSSCGLYITFDVDDVSNSEIFLFQH